MFLNAEERAALRAAKSIANVETLSLSQAHSHIVAIRERLAEIKTEDNSIFTGLLADFKFGPKAASVLALTAMAILAVTIYMTIGSALANVGIIS